MSDLRRREFIALLGGNVAGHRARTAAGDAGDWVSQRHGAHRVGALRDPVPTGTE
jgi:hypothetical protein